MKEKVLCFAVAFLFFIHVFPQDVDEGLLKTDSCFLGVKVVPKTNVAITKTFCIGDKITVKLSNNKIIRDKISGLHENSIGTEGGAKINVSEIKWIKKSRLNPVNVVIGGIVISGGLAIIIHLSQGNVDFDDIPLQAGIGVALVGSGIAIMTSRTKFHIEKGDKLILKH